MQVFRCNICGDPYIGTEKPSHCPFCGAHANYLVNASEWHDTNNIELSEVSKKNLLEALQLEVNNADFYRKGFQAAKDPYFQALFKGLSKIEAEHAATILKLLKVDKPEAKQELPILNTEKEYLDLAHGREVRANAFYKQAAQEAVEDRVREVFTALVEIENDHIKLSE